MVEKIRGSPMRSEVGVGIRRLEKVRGGHLNSRALHGDGSDG